MTELNIHRHCRMSLVSWTMSTSLFEEPSKLAGLPLYLRYLTCSVCTCAGCWWGGHGTHGAAPHITHEPHSHWGKGAGYSGIPHPRQRQDILRLQRADKLRLQRADILRLQRADIVRLQRADKLRLQRVDILRLKREDIVSERADKLRL